MFSVIPNIYNKKTKGPARCTSPSAHTTTWNTCCHNTALLIKMYHYWLFIQKCKFSQAQCKLWGRSKWTETCRSECRIF